MNADNLERDFFSVSGNGTTIHYCGYTYFIDDDEGWRSVEKCGAEMPMKDFIALAKKTKDDENSYGLFYWADEIKTYIGDYDENGIKKLVSNYYGSTKTGIEIEETHPGKHVTIDDIINGLEDGDYWI